MPSFVCGYEGEKKLLLAFSGGADSTALLHALIPWAAQHGFALFAAHVEHGIRGQASLDDREHCRTECEKAGIPFFSASFPVPELARKTGQSLETAARQVRYDYFRERMEEERIPFLLTAHHADDQAETMLFRLARGTGPAGLAGISPIRAFGPGRYLVRPLLHSTKESLVAFCRERGLSYVQDETNAQDDAARNRIRNHVLPALSDLFPQASQRMSRTADLLRLDEEYLQDRTQLYLESRGDLLDEMRPGYVKGQIRLILDPHPALGARVLIRLLSEAFGGQTAEERHIRTVLSRLGQEDFTLELPDRIRFCAKGETFVMDRPTESPMQTRFDPVPLEEGSFLFAYGGARIRLSMDAGPNPPSFPPVDKGVQTIFTQLSLPAAILEKEQLEFRPRIPGDCLGQNGMHLPVKNIFTDAGLAPDVRKILPLLAVRDSRRILWVPLPEKNPSRVCDALRQSLPGTPPFFHCVIQFQFHTDRTDR